MIILVSFFLSSSLYFFLVPVMFFHSIVNPRLLARKKTFSPCRRCHCNQTIICRKRPADPKGRLARRRRVDMQRRISCIFESAFVPRNSAFFFFDKLSSNVVPYFSRFSIYSFIHTITLAPSHFRSRVLFLFLSRSLLFFLTFIRISWDYAPANFNSL